MFTKSQDDRTPGPAQTGRYDTGGRSASGQGSVLSADLKVTGIIATEGALEVHGTVEGEIAAAMLLIGHEGAVSGKVQAGQAEVRGRLAGEIACGTLMLRAAAQMKADATCGVLVIESGAQVEGRFARPAPEPARIAPPAPASAPASGPPPPKDQRGGME